MECIMSETIKNGNPDLIPVDEEQEEPAERPYRDGSMPTECWNREDY